MVLQEFHFIPIVYERPLLCWARLPLGAGVMLRQPFENVGWHADHDGIVGWGVVAGRMFLVSDPGLAFGAPGSRAGLEFEDQGLERWVIVAIWQLRIVAQSDLTVSNLSGLLRLDERQVASA